MQQVRAEEEEGDYGPSSGGYDQLGYGTLTSRWTLRCDAPGVGPGLAITSEVSDRGVAPRAHHAIGPLPCMAIGCCAL